MRAHFVRLDGEAMSTEAEKPVVTTPRTQPKQLKTLTLAELELVVGASPGRININ